MRLFSKPKRFLESLTRPVAQASAARHDYERITLNQFDSNTEDAEKSVSWSMRVAAAWSWRFLVVITAVAVIAYMAYYVEIIVVPAFVALLLTVILQPLHRLLCKVIPPAWSAAISLLLGVGVVATLLSVASTQILYGISGITTKAQLGFQKVISWLRDGPLKLDQGQIQNYLDQLQSEVLGYVQRNTSSLASGAITATASIGTLATGMLITLFCLFFFLKDGRELWVWALRALPQKARIPVHEACVRGWITLGSYARTQIAVAAIDSVSIGIVAYFIGVNFAVPLAIIIFLGSLIPIVGILVTGSLAVLVVLFDSGPWMALAMIIIILVAYMVEGSLLQPLLMSGAVNLHPVAVLLAVTAGGYVASIPGALFAVPLVAFVNTVVLYLHGYDKFPALSHDKNRVGGTTEEIIMLVEGSKERSKAGIDKAARDAAIKEEAGSPKAQKEPKEPEKPKGEEADSAPAVDPKEH